MKQPPQHSLAERKKWRFPAYTREAVAIETDTSLPGARVVRVLEDLRERRGLPQQIVVDNGTEFTSRVVEGTSWITPARPLSSVQ